MFWRVFGICAAFAILWNNLAQAKIFTDAFSGQGRGCSGNLYIRTKTIEWDTQFSVCQSPYTILKKTFASKPADFDYILYKQKKFRHLTRECGYPYVALYYYDFYDAPGYANHWVVAGFPSLESYKRFPYRQVVTGEIPSPNDVLRCDLTIYTGRHETNISY